MAKTTLKAGSSSCTNWANEPGERVSVKPVLAVAASATGINRTGGFSGRGRAIKKMIANGKEKAKPRPACLSAFFICPPSNKFKQVSTKKRHNAVQSVLSSPCENNSEPTVKNKVANNKICQSRMSLLSYDFNNAIISKNDKPPS